MNKRYAYDANNRVIRLIAVWKKSMHTIFVYIPYVIFALGVILLAIRSWLIEQFGCISVLGVRNRRKLTAIIRQLICFDMRKPLLRALQIRWNQRYIISHKISLTGKYSLFKSPRSDTTRICVRVLSDLWIRKWFIGVQPLPEPMLTYYHITMTS